MDVKHACLGLLSRAEATGYEIRKQFEEGPYSHFFEANYGSIYPALARLCEEGLATVREVEEPGRPRRKVYSITGAGREVFRAALCDAAAPDRWRSEWVFTMYFAEQLPPEVVRRRIAERIAFHEAQLAGIDSCSGEGVTAGVRFVLGMGRAYSRAMATYLAAEGDALIDQLRKPRDSAV